LYQLVAALTEMDGDTKDVILEVKCDSKDLHVVEHKDVNLIIL